MQKTVIFIATTRTSYLIFTRLLSVFVCRNSFKNIKNFISVLLSTGQDTTCALQISADRTPLVHFKLVPAKDV